MNHAELLEQKLLSCFPDESIRVKVRAILETYGSENHEQEPYRVRLAILKLAGTEVPEIEKWAGFAKEDFRDILTWAEYPRQSKKWSAKGAEKQQLIEADLNEYQAWLNT